MTNNHATQKEAQSWSESDISQEQIYVISIIHRCRFLWSRLNKLLQKSKLLITGVEYYSVSEFAREFKTDLDRAHCGPTYVWPKGIGTPPTPKVFSIFYILEKADPQSDSYKLARRVMIVLEALYVIERQFNSLISLVDDSWYAQSDLFQEQLTELINIFQQSQAYTKELLLLLAESVVLNKLTRNEPKAIITQSINMRTTHIKTLQAIYDTHPEILAVEKIAEKTKRAKGTVLRSLTMLSEYGFVTQDKDKHYVITKYGLEYFREYFDQ